MDGIWSEFAEEGLNDPKTEEVFDFWKVDSIVKEALNAGKSQDEIINEIGLKNFNLYVMNAI